MVHRECFERWQGRSEQNKLIDWKLELEDGWYCGVLDALVIVHRSWALNNQSGSSSIGGDSNGNSKSPQLPGVSSLWH